MRQLPVTDPGVPNARTPVRYLLWVARDQWASQVGSILFGVIWMAASALLPAVVGRGIDAGVADQDMRALLLWALALLGLGLVAAGAGMMRHRFAVTNWLSAAYLTVQTVTRHTVKIGAALPRQISTGEAVSVSATDIDHIGGTFDVLGRSAGAVVGFVLVAVLVLTSSPPLGLLLLIGVPLLTLTLGPLLRPLHRRQEAQRELVGELTTRANDIVAGLRVLRGIGGEAVFGARYRQRSQEVRQAGVRVARVQSVLDAVHVLLPGVFVTFVTWVAARFAVAGTITIGELVAFYGYVTFLVLPLRIVSETAERWIRGHVAARRVIRILNLTPGVTEPTDPREVPAAEEGVELIDVASGLKVLSGRTVAVVATDPADAAGIAERLGRYVDGEVSWRGVPLHRVSVERVRRGIMVLDPHTQLFAGRLRDQLDPHGDGDPERIKAALWAASATDILDGLPDGLDTKVEQQGRSFSGGQRQRLMLARALLCDPEVLILVEPTSAVDAHTEARIAERLTTARAGRTTVVMSTSPLLLDHVDEVAFVVDGAVVATGQHRELLETNPHYREVVIRDSGQSDEADEIDKPGRSEEVMA